MQLAVPVPVPEQPILIRILEKDNNLRGDLFGRLMADLFVALGYEQPHLNIQRSGRELDLVADHRLEAHRAIGECKATTSTIGGDDLNKFVGSLDAEQDKRPVTGYFISLAGFKETALEQEKHRSNKLILLSGPQVVEELIKGRILISRERATEIAGRCRATLNDLVLDPQVELLAHKRGWIWAIYYSHGKSRTHFVLIHSDGTLLAHAVAEEIISADRMCSGRLYSLTCLNPKPADDATVELHAASALAAYRQYLASECGFIHLDGLPADTEVGSRRLKLESLFVPLHLDVTRHGKETITERQTVGDALAQHPRLALLAPPGGGKSTLLKRLAVAYGDSSRHAQIADNLPERDWLPLFFRCRELRSLARGSFSELLEALSQREPIRLHAPAFRTYVDRALLQGRVLLLVDGLDEISDPGDRAAFVCTLRSALHAYPGIAIVVTSREAGFRHVAAHLAPVCVQVTLSAFDEADISRLSVAWHRELLGDTEKVRTDAEQLAITIAQNDRIRRLAINPLLLTTLLLVKRWVGSLPTRRAVLYGKAVELLLMTWNTEGHEPIPEEEALPQLCYVASAMMLQGIQKVSRRRLAALLQESRRALPTELGYVKGTVEDFIHRVEDRSSLLMMTGYDVDDGKLSEFFEFRHLTFQEYLTARAMVEGWHPGRTDCDTLLDVLKPHFNSPTWTEVVPLAAVLGGKATEAVIRDLTYAAGSDTKQGLDSRVYSILGSCLADEAAARPETIRAALRVLVTFGRQLERASFASLLARGRYGAELRAEANQALLFSAQEPTSPATALATTVWWQSIGSENAEGFGAAVATFRELLSRPERAAQHEGSLGLLMFCYHLTRHPKLNPVTWADEIRQATVAVLPLLFSQASEDQCVACWTLSWVGACKVWTPCSDPDVLGKLVAIWRSAANREVRRFAAWAVAAQRLAPRDSGLCASLSRLECIEILERYNTFDIEFEKPCVLVLAWYLGLLPPEELSQRAQEWLNKMSERLNSASATVRKIADNLATQPK